MTIQAKKRAFVFCATACAANLVGTFASIWLPTVLCGADPPLHVINAAKSTMHICFLATSALAIFSVILYCEVNASEQE